MWLYMPFVCPPLLLFIWRRPTTFIIIIIYPSYNKATIHHHKGDRGYNQNKLLTWAKEDWEKDEKFSLLQTSRVENSNWLTFCFFRSLWETFWRFDLFGDGSSLINSILSLFIFSRVSAIIFALFNHTTAHEFITAGIETVLGRDWWCYNRRK